MSYSGGDGQTLGIILTPRHICDLMCDLVEVQSDDIVLDPTCGTGGFLISAMHKMLSGVQSSQKRSDIKKKQLHGFELQSNMFVIAVANMILRKDGNANIECCDFLAKNPAQTQLKGANVGLMNPPYSQGAKADPSQYELSFVEHLLDSLVEGGRAAVIIPQSSLTGKTVDERNFKESILKKHTLEGVITCNTDTFYGVGVNPVIAVFTANVPHDPEKVCKFIDFRSDGYEVMAHIGLMDNGSAKDKKQHLLDVWNGKALAPTKFCVTSTVQASDEWLHGFYYFNDEIPTEADFEKVIGEYLTFEFSMFMQNKEYLFGKEKKRINLLGEIKDIPDLEDKVWKPFDLTHIFDHIKRGKRLKKADHIEGKIPYVSSTATANGNDGTCGNSRGVRKFSNCLTIANSGSVGSCFYHPYEFVASDHVTALVKDSASEPLCLGLSLLVGRIGEKYNFNREINDARISRELIMLPVNNEGVPDYGYIEQYAKNMMIKKYMQYLSYLENQK